jgi:uncharacterized protein (TIGR00369 family)
VGEGNDTTGWLDGKTSLAGMAGWADNAAIMDNDVIMSCTTSPALAPHGLNDLRSRITQGTSDPSMGVTLGFRLVEVDHGQAVFEGRPDERVYNPMGTVHGGYAATLLDSACGLAVHTTLAAGRGYTTLELKVSYLRAMTSASGTVRAVGRIVSIGRRVAFAEATLHDGAGRLCASATSTLLVFDLLSAVSD